MLHNVLAKRAQQWKPSAIPLILRVLFLAVRGVGVPAPRRVPSSEGICYCHCGSFCLREAVQGTITSAHMTNNWGVTLMDNPIDLAGSLLYDDELKWWPIGCMISNCNDILMPNWLVWQTAKQSWEKVWWVPAVGRKSSWIGMCPLGLLCPWMMGSLGPVWIIVSACSTHILELLLYHKVESVELKCEYRIHQTGVWFMPRVEDHLNYH